MESIENSTIAKISTFLKRQPRGATFVHTDFYKFGSCSNVRTVLVRLCERNQLVRLCQGVYMKPGAPEPDTIHIAKEIARRSGSTTVLKSDEYKGATRIITFYTDGSTRSVTLQDGTVIKFLHANK